MVEAEIKTLEDRELSLMEALEEGRSIEQSCQEKLQHEEQSIADELQELERESAKLRIELSR